MHASLNITFNILFRYDDAHFAGSKYQSAHNASALLQIADPAVAVISAAADDDSAAAACHSDKRMKPTIE